MTFKFKKCCFAKTTVKFLGHMVGNGSTTVMPDKISTIMNLPEPESKKMLRSFLGLCSYYRSFIPLFAETAAALFEMTNGVTRGKVTFNELQRAAFQELKAKLCNSTALGTPDYTRPFQIQTDASDQAVAGCLSQRSDDGVERPLGFASTKLTEVQKRWSTIEKEAYGSISTKVPI